MKKVIIKSVLNVTGINELPTTPKQFRQFCYSPYGTLGMALLMLDEYEKYGDMWMDCLAMILNEYKIDSINKSILDELLHKFTTDFENNILTSKKYYIIIKTMCDNKNICDNININELLSIIDKCDDEFIKVSLSKSISSKYIGYYNWDKFHHIIDWRIFQENNDICEIIENAAYDCDHKDYADIINCLTTKDYLINNLDYNYVISKGVNNHTTLFDDNKLLIKLLFDYKKYNISFNILCEFCQNRYISNDVIDFICNQYSPDNKSWDYHKKELIVSIMINNLTKQRLELVIRKYPSFFLKSEDIRSLIKQEFKWNWKMRKFIRKFES